MGSTTRQAVEEGVFSTGQLAKILKVAPRTISKWFDSGRLRGYRIPGSNDRRVSRAEALRFAREHRFPAEAHERLGMPAGLVVGSDDARVLAALHEAVGGGVELREAPTWYDLGACAQNTGVTVLDCQTLCRSWVAYHLPAVAEHARAVVLASEDEANPAEFAAAALVALRPFEAAGLARDVVGLLLAGKGVSGG